MPISIQPKSSVANIPHLNHAQLDGRFISTVHFWHDGVWTLYLETEEGMRAIPAWPAEGFYFGKSAQAETDFKLHFLDFTAQRACYLGLEKPILGIRDDLFNMGASVAKIKLLHDTKAQNSLGVTRMVATEVEYIYSLCRGIYDLLQEYASKLWEMYKPAEPTKQKGKNQPKMYPTLPNSFAEMALNNGTPRSVAELTAKYRIPIDWASIYVFHADFFADIRRFRDNVVHNGSYVGSVFDSDYGFLIRKDKRPFNTFKFDLWKEEEVYENDVAPLMPALGQVIFRTLVTLEDFAKMLEQNFEFHEPVAPGFTFYMRGYYDKELAELLKDAMGRMREEEGGGRQGR